MPNVNVDVKADYGQQKYNAPSGYGQPGGVESSIGPQINTFFWQRKALIELKKQMYFSRFADPVTMPKNYGKELVKYHYLPLLDDRNINDQGIDANGVSTDMKASIHINMPGIGALQNQYLSYWAIGEGATEAAAQADAILKAEDIFKNLGVFDTDYATTKAALEALSDPWVIDDTLPVVPGTGNLYGSSKDVGTILSKLPVLSETGGRVNRVGFRRILIKGTFEKFGFFTESTLEADQFDTDAERQMHINRETIRGATELTEDMLQADLLNNAGVVRYGGNAVSMDQVNGEVGTESLVTYDSLIRLGIDLVDNRMPPDIKLIDGSRMIDTKTIPNSYAMLIGSELIPQLRRMVDSFGNPAFIEYQKYANGGNILPGEIGSIGQFRFILVPEMQHWAGAGAPVTNNAGYRESNGHYNVYPMLVIGSKAFTTIGFQTSGRNHKFKIHTVKPGSKESYSRFDPYGETGYHSIKWWYGFMMLRPEWLAVVKTVATY